MCLDVNNVDQEAVCVQAGSCQLHFNVVVVGVSLIFCSPVATNQEVLSDEISFDSNSVHGEWLLLYLSEAQGMTHNMRVQGCARLYG